MLTNPFVNNKKEKKGRKKKVVCIGGGNAMPMALLSQLRNYPVKITVISAVLDSGGSSGRLRRDYGVVSFGDLRRAFLALSDLNPFLKRVLDYRFDSGEMKGHNLGNLMMLAIHLNAERSYGETFRKVNSLLGNDFKIYPSTAFSSSELHAILENDEHIIGETNIDVPKHDPKLKIKELFLTPKAKACPHVVEAIEDADAVIIGPGDIYSSLVQILLVDGLSQAIRRSKAKKIYLCNIMNKNGESNGFSVKDFTEVIEKYMGTELDYVVYNKKMVPEDRYIEVKKKHPELLSMVRVDEGLDVKKFIGKNLLLSDNNPIHNSKVLTKTVMELIG